MSDLISNKQILKIAKKKVAVFFAISCTVTLPQLGFEFMARLQRLLTEIDELICFIDAELEQNATGTCVEMYGEIY